MCIFSAWVYIYIYETRGVWRGEAQGKLEFLGEIMLHLRPF